MSGLVDLYIEAWFILQLCSARQIFELTNTYSYKYYCAGKSDILKEEI